MMFKKILFSLICIIFCSLHVYNSAFAISSNTLIDDIDSFVEEQKEKAKIPGLAVVVIKDGKTIYKETKGYSDIESQKLVSDSTMFEIGSNTKAFTALAILKLEEEGKLKLSDPISKYLTWFDATFEGKSADIKLEHFLYHSSGIPYYTMVDIPKSSSEHALEENIRALSGVELKEAPGKEYHYATINYDVLGLVIEKVTSTKYEDYITTNILSPLGLNGMSVGRPSDESNISTGYKLAFGKPFPYKAPDYRGNTPAAYILTDLNNAEKWLRIQMGLEHKEWFNLISQSHQPDRSVEPTIDGSSYAAGWAIYQDGDGMVAHLGSNPNYSAHTLFRLGQKNYAVTVLANLSSSNVQKIGQGIMELMDGEEISVSDSLDGYIKIDWVSTLILGVGAIFTISLIAFLGLLIKEVIQGKRKLRKLGVKESAIMFLATILIVIYELAIFYIPDIFLGRANWEFIKVWAPFTLSLAGWTLRIIGFVYYLYFIFLHVTIGTKNKVVFNLIILSIVSGLANSLLIFIINSSIGIEDEDRNRIFMYFIMVVIVYLIGQKYVRGGLVTLTNEFLYEKRKELINRLINSSYESIDRSVKSNIYATLNGDMEVISRAVNSLVTAGTNLITLLVCIVYLSFIQFEGFLLSVGLIVLGLTLYILTGRVSQRFWEKNRDVQNIFYKLIEDMISGFKELHMRQKKKSAFYKDIIEQCLKLKNFRIKGDLKFINAYVLGEFLFIIVLGLSVFLLPNIIDSFEDTTILNFVVVFLFIIGPVNGLLSTVPVLFQAKVSWGRVVQLEKELKTSAHPPIDEEVLLEEFYHIELEDVSYQYFGEDSFNVGPLNAHFRSGEVTFIVGSNGSGKSTLANLIMGLYEPRGGSIKINGSSLSSKQLGEYFSAVQSNYYLFDRLYGIETNGREEEIKRYLKLFKLEAKVQIQNGEFTTTKLSTGQRKRLALLICLLEDSPIYLFDEWAAEQDPQFRDLFYHEFIPDLKTRGKCIIAITHDDRYFDIADQVIKMELGKIVDSNYSSKTGYIYQPSLN
ncbi:MULTISPECIES: cyclic peptide export ABC transporter [unclassified Niallia]|uniref:cyclic peptide export ABC transporter n=1 Tax=unclassified Niallia TaxID=2837522 RepID=UPI0030F64208